MERKIEPYVPREIDWQPRPSEPEPVRKSIPSDSANLRGQISRVWEHHKRHVDETRHSLETLADLTGTETGILNAQVNELKKQIDEMRGELNLLRASTQAALEKHSD